MDSDYIPIPKPDRGIEVTIPLSEIQRIRDGLAKLKVYHEQIRVLWRQVAALHQRLAKEHPRNQQQVILR